MQTDPWEYLRNTTPARIALGRAGASLPTAAVLAFAADHADARDAVYSELDVNAFQQSLNLPIIKLHSQAPDRKTYLQRPDLGRRLDPSCIRLFQESDEFDIACIVADGLSATAVQHHAAELLHELLHLLNEKRMRIAPICVVQQARVAIQDEIGSLLNARLALILIGERPGLGVSDSLGAYFVYRPAIGKTDADRNCVSNIHPRHLPPKAAAITLIWLIEQSLVRQLSGVQLKDDRTKNEIAASASHASLDPLLTQRRREQPDLKRLRVD